MLRSSKKDLKTKGLKRMPQMGHDSHDLQNTRSSILHFLEKKTEGPTNWLVEIMT